jgi:acyl carrier protein
MIGMTRDQLQEEVIQVMAGLSNEWEYDGPLSPETRFFADMDLKSLDFVILSTAIVKRFGRVPFDEFYSRLADLEPETREVTVSQFVDFIYENPPSA